MLEWVFWCPGSGLREADPAQRAAAELQQSSVCPWRAELLWKSGKTGAGYEPGPEPPSRPGTKQVSQPGGMNTLVNQIPKQM